MDKNRKCFESDNNNKENTGDNIPPPPYEEINTIDEFGFDKPTKARPSAPFDKNNFSSTASTLSPSTSLSGSVNINQRRDEAENFHSDFFQKPPKFLLYPSKSMPEEEASEDHDDKFGSQGRRPKTAEHQMRVVATPVVFTPQNQPNNTGVTMSASQLPQQINPAAVGYIVDNYLPRYSHRMVCPNCKVAVNSAVQYVSGQLTHIMAIVACWFTCCLACVPYFIDDVKDAEHLCPQCGAILGYNRKKIF